MTRLEAAVAELVDAIREVSARNDRPAEPERLLDVDEARRALGNIARSTLYELMDRGELRSLTIGRRRVIPSSAIAELASKAR